MTSELDDIPPAAQGEESSAAASPSSAVALPALDRFGCGYLVVEDQERIVEANAAARLILGGAAGSLEDLGQLTTAFRRLLARTPNKPALGPLCWIVIWNKHEAPFVLNQAANVVPHGTSVVMLLDLDAHLRPNPFMLQRMFGLTMAETRLALQLASGDLPADVARNFHLSPATIRSQLAAVFAKTRTSRQAELVVLLDRIALLP